jgi:hypothetical protein
MRKIHGQNQRRAYSGCETHASVRAVRSKPAAFLSHPVAENHPVMVSEAEPPLPIAQSLTKINSKMRKEKTIKKWLDELPEPFKKNLFPKHYAALLFGKIHRKVTNTGR